MGATGFLGGVGNLFGAFGGNGANTDRQQQLKGYGDLSNVFNYGFNTGKSTFGTGMNAEQSGLQQLSAPAQYYQKLLSGNRAAAMSAVAPTVNAVNSQTDANARQASAMGTARGGGVNVGNQQVDTTKQGLVENAITGAREGAAAGATGVAGATAGIGSSIAGQALNLLGLGEHAAQNLTEDASQSRLASQQLHGQKMHDIGAGLTSTLLSMYPQLNTSGTGGGG